MKKNLLVLIVISGFVLTTACSLKPRAHNRAAVAPQVVANEDCERPEAQSVRFYLGQDNGDNTVETARVKGTGYGAPPKKYYPQYQRSLLAMRASKIDAYRTLAETINGIHIWGGTTLGNMAVQNDTYRVFLNSYIRGAKVESVTKMEDGNYQTVVSTIVDQNFLNYVLSGRLTQNAGCGAQSGAYVASNGQVPIIYSENIAPSSFYYSE